MSFFSIFGGFSHKTTSIANPEQGIPDVDEKFRYLYITALWQGLNPEGLSNPDDAESDTLGLLASLYAPGPYSRGNILAGYYVQRKENPEDDRPIITPLSEQGMADIIVVTAEQGHGVMGAPASGIYGGEIFNGSQDEKYNAFKIHPPPSKGISLSI